jgi:alanine transaminase
MVVINPGNPTGSCLSEQNILELLEFCYEERIVLLADEVYQSNIYDPETQPFHSFRSVLKKNEDRLRGLELFSFHSISKGFTGECGIRGGYYQMENIHPDITAQILKLASLQLCPNVIGQLMVDLRVKPPAPDTPSRTTFDAESHGIIESLKRRAARLSAALNTLPACSCVPVSSSMYAFPNIVLPPRAIAEAKRLGKAPDEFYAISLLESQGLCVVPGSGFRQRPGTFHIRTTILPAEEDFADVTERFSQHHLEFLQKWADPEWIAAHEQPAEKL